MQFATSQFLGNIGAPLRDNEYDSEDEPVEEFEHSSMGSLIQVETGRMSFW